MSGISTINTLNRLEQLGLAVSESNFEEKPMAHARYQPNDYDPGKISMDVEFHLQIARMTHNRSESSLAVKSHLDNPLPPC